MFIQEILSENLYQKNILSLIINNRKYFRVEFGEITKIT